MSYKPTAAELHAAHEDERSALARTRKLERYTEDVLTRAHERHLRRMHPLMGTSNRPSDDFEGAVE
jgi:hypothetical protein